MNCPHKMSYRFCPECCEKAQEQRVQRARSGAPSKNCLQCKKPCTRQVRRLCGHAGVFRFCNDACQELYEKALLEQMKAIW